jgi:5-formyltetrahydrofolate cyclo-ligase
MKTLDGTAPAGADGTGQAAAKAALRATLKATRGNLGETDRVARSTVIGERLLNLDAVRNACRVFAYLSSGPEVDTHALLRRLLAEGKMVCVPKILSRVEMVACRLTDWSRLAPAQLGILTPMDTVIDRGPFDIALTPGLGFTPAGDRIGFGAGYYDRWFASHAVGLKIALAFEVQVVAAIPVTDRDVPIDLLVTEQRLIDTRASRAPG